MPKTPVATVVVAIGDSLIEGVAARPNGGWVNLFADHLSASGQPARLINSGDGGDTVVGVRHRLKEDCLKYQPGLIILGIGVNDSRLRPSLGTSEVPISLFRRELGKLLSTLKRTGAEILVSGQVPVIDDLVDPYKDDKHYRRELQKAYEHALLTLAAKHGVYFLENFARWTERGENFIRSHLADGLHPNDAGHQELAKYAANFYSLHVDRQG